MLKYPRRYWGWWLLQTIHQLWLQAQMSQLGDLENCLRSPSPVAALVELYQRHPSPTRKLFLQATEI
eukprot:gene564-386_t